MHSDKPFDCVEMKNAIQTRHLRERQGLADERVRQKIADRLATSDDAVARKWRKLTLRDSVGESPARKT